MFAQCQSIESIYRSIFCLPESEKSLNIPKTKSMTAAGGLMNREDLVLYGELVKNYFVQYHRLLW